jgi:hypothetical protein
MTKQYIKYYRILGVEPGVTWAQLRKAYKGLVNTWHPDRFQQDPRQKNLAEERTKEITQSFQELAEYYKEFGVLPHASNAMDTPVKDGSSWQNSPDSHPVYENQDIDIPAADITPPQAHKSNRRKFYVRIMATAALAGIAYFVWQGAPWERPDELSQTEIPMQQSEANKTNDDSGQQPPPAGKYFTYGTPLGEVYSIQGVPSKTEQDTWYYGKSKVYFAKGKVLHWDEDPGNLLKAKITSGNENTKARFFEKGSSKNEVLAIQGKPDRDAGNVWDYGVSRVYFDNDRVKGWDESPFNPLRVRQ